MAAPGVFHWMLTCVLLLLCCSEVLPAASRSSRNYYETLEVEPTATDRQIKKAFRLLAVKYHPDKNKSADAEKTFREIAEAYQVLSNKEKRKLYDGLGHEAFLNNDASSDSYDHETGFSFRPEDLFQDFQDSPFAEDQSHWTFHPGGEDDDIVIELNNFAEPGFVFYFGDEDEDEDEDEEKEEDFFFF